MQLASMDIDICPDRLLAIADPERQIDGAPPEATAEVILKVLNRRDDTLAQESVRCSVATQLCVSLTCSGSSDLTLRLWFGLRLLFEQARQAREGGLIPLPAEGRHAPGVPVRSASARLAEGWGAALSSASAMMGQ